MTASRTLALMALKERARMAQTLGDLREVVTQKQDAARMADRLQAALTERRAESGTVQSMATLRAERTMVGQILSEIDKQKAREAALAEALTEAQARLAKEEHRISLLTDKAQAARQAEAEARQALRDAAMPPRKR